jgi:hypothetical protein
MRHYAGRLAVLGYLLIYRQLQLRRGAMPTGSTVTAFPALCRSCRNGST